VPANDILIGIGSSSHLPHHVKCKAWQVFSLTVQNNTLIHSHLLRQTIQKIMKVFILKIYCIYPSLHHFYVTNKWIMRSEARSH